MSTTASTSDIAAGHVQSMTDDFIKVSARLQQIGVGVVQISVGRDGVCIWPSYEGRRATLGDTIAEAFDLSDRVQEITGWVAKGEWAGVSVTVYNITPPAPVCGCGQPCNHGATS